MDAKAELIRKKYLYRRLVMSKKVNLPLDSARGMVGPDCAYHLYSQFNPKTDAETRNGDESSDDQVS